MAKPLVSSKAVAMYLLIHSLLLLPLSVGVLCMFLVLLFRNSCTSSFAIILVGKGKFVVLLLLYS